MVGSRNFGVCQQCTQLPPSFPILLVWTHELLFEKVFKLECSSLVTECVAACPKSFNQSFLSSFLHLFILSHCLKVNPVARRPVVLHVLSRLRLRCISQLISSLRPVGRHSAVSESLPSGSVLLRRRPGHVEAKLFRHLVTALHSSLLVIADPMQHHAEKLRRVFGTG